jgi:hypothetical protein
MGEEDGDNGVHLNCLDRHVGPWELRKRRELVPETTGELYRVGREREKRERERARAREQEKELTRSTVDNCQRRLGASWAVKDII